MATSLDTPRTPLPPIVKNAAIGQTFVGALVNYQQRDRTKQTDSGERVLDLKPNGKPKQELVLTLVTMPGTDAPTALGGVSAVPAPGDVVRMIIKGQTFSQWIDAKNNLGPLSTGDVVTQVLDHAQVFNGAGKPVGDKITAQADVDALPRNTTVGIYGTLTLRKPTKDETKWAEMADEVHHAARSTTPLEDDGPEEPF